MSLYFLVAIFVFIIGFAGLFYFINKKFSQPEKKDDKGMILLQNQMNELQRMVQSHFQESSKMMQRQIGGSAKIIQEVTEKLVKLDETNRQVVGFADQLKNLQDVLKNPKQRGILGEYYLETLLKNIFPPNIYQMQYAFKNGEIVDAVIFYQDKIIPIDSKFSLENYNRILEADGEERLQFEKVFRQDLKNRIDETAKYVRPQEGTTEFAFMFIPAEAIYYDLLMNQVGAVKSNTRDLVEYAYKDKKVIIVSPTSFMAYLQTVLHGMRAQQIEKSAKEIIKRVQVLGKHLAVYDDYMAKLGGHLGTTVNSYNAAYKELGKIDKDVLKIGGESGGIEPAQIDRPKAADGGLI